VHRFIVHLSKGLIREQTTRRSIMFFGLIAALVLLFLGATFFDTWLRERPWLFLLYWAACAWVTLLAVLLAMFDLLLVRAAVRRERREIARQILKNENSTHEDAP
jgi:hypothetical protein